MLEPGRIGREIERGIRIFRTGQAEQRLALTLALGLLSVSYLASATQVPLIPAQWVYFLLWANGTLVIGAFLWLALRLWRKAYTSRPGPSEAAEPLPTAIKGALSFGPADGALFRRLERGAELAALLGWVADDQIPLVCVMGESGAGKTSLLRSGLVHELKQVGVPTVYWEAVSTDSLPRLLRAVEATVQNLSSPEEVPQHEPLAVVVDQLEQLDPETATCREVFEFLGRMSSAFPPHRVTWIVAFRRDYLPTWRDFELSNRLNPPTLSLRHLTRRQAHNVMVVLGEAAELTFDHSLLDSFVRTAAHHDRVAPVYVGVGMLVLTRLARRTGKAHLTLNDYKLAEESGGLLTQYLQECLERFLDSERSGILQVLRRLVDFEENKRVPEGRSLAQLAQGSPLTQANLGACLEHLSSTDVRILEVVREGPKRYRILHDAFVPAIRALCGEVLAEEEKAALDFEAGFRAWLNNGEKAQYLLSGRRIEAALRYSRLLLRGNGTNESRSRYLRLSLRLRSQRRAALCAFALSLLAIVGVLFHAQEAEGYRTALISWGLPAALYEAQDHLKALEIYDFPLTNLEWLKGPIKELVLRGTHLGSFVGLPVSLETLTVEVTSSNMSTFAELQKLSSLQKLTLELSGWEGWGWPVVRDLRSLTELKINARVSRVTTFPEMENLPSLQTLTLEMWGPGVASLPQLEKLTSLRTLSLEGGYLGVLDWTELEKLTQLQTLTLGTVIRSTPRGTPRPRDPAQNWPDLGKLPSLQTLTVLNLSSLPELTKATSLRTLTLYLNSSLDDWSELEELTWLEKLYINVHYDELTSWPELGRLASLKELTLHMRGSKTPSLPRLEGLTSLEVLSLYLFDSNVSNLPSLEKLTSLRSLELVLAGC